MYKLISLKEISDSQEFSCGERFRLYGIGMNNLEKDEDYYEYMLIDNHDEYMIAANVSDRAGWIKAGYVIAHIMKSVKIERNIVTGKALKFSLGDSKVFWLKRK